RRRHRAKRLAASARRDAPPLAAPARDRPPGLTPGRLTVKAPGAMRREPDARIVNDIATAARPGRVLRSCARRRATSFAMAPLRDGGLGASRVQATERSDAAVLIDQLGARRKPGIAS